MRPECFRQKLLSNSKRCLTKETERRFFTRAYPWYYGEGDPSASRPRSSSRLLQREKEEANGQECGDYHFDRACLVCGSHRSGKTHDKTIAEAQCTIPYPCILWQEIGYQSYAPRNMAIIQPTKKPRGKEFTADQKDENKTISSIRIKVEHTISGIRTQRGVSGHCQLRKDRFVDKIFSLSTCILNWRLSIPR